MLSATEESSLCLLISRTSIIIDEWIEKIIEDNCSIQSSIYWKLKEMNIIMNELKNDSSTSLCMDFRLRLTVLTLITAIYQTETEILKRRNDKSDNKNESENNNDFQQRVVGCLGQILLFTRYSSSENKPEVLSSYQIGQMVSDSFFAVPVVQVCELLKHDARILVDQPVAREPRSCSRKKTIAKKSTKIDCQSAAFYSTANEIPKFYPVILFPCSNSLFAYQVPWDSLSLLSLQDITIGIDLEIFATMLKQWRLNARVLSKFHNPFPRSTFSFADPHYTQNFFIVNPTNDLSASERTIPFTMLNPPTKGFFNQHPKGIHLLSMSIVHPSIVVYFQCLKRCICGQPLMSMYIVVIVEV